MSHTTTDASFAADVIASPIPVLVDFTATWCPPCRMIEPILARISEVEAARMKVVSLDVDENPLMTAKYQVLGMPTLALFVNGEVAVQFTGARPQAAIMQLIEPYLPAAVSAVG